MKKKKSSFLAIFIVIITLLWLNNTSLFIKNNGNIKFLAHRGLAQTFDFSKVDWDTNTVTIIDNPEHPYLENTLESMQISFDYGADVVELDIKATKDNKLAVSHDEN